MIVGYRAVVDPAAVGRALRVLVEVDVSATDRETIEEFEDTVAGYEEVDEFHRMFGRPDYFIRVSVADHAAYERFMTEKLAGLPGVLRVTSHLAMKKIKADT